MQKPPDSLSFELGKFKASAVGRFSICVLAGLVLIGLAVVATGFVSVPFLSAGT